jgi:hypothetical protein
MISHLRLPATLACSLTLGVFSSSNAKETAPELAHPSAPPRGSLIQSPPARTASLTASNVLDALTAFPEAERVLELISPPRCGIDVYHLQYNTIDPVGVPITASAALMVPTGGDERCHGPRPIVLYAHGTEVRRTLNQADIVNVDNQEALLAAAAFTAQGYVLVAPNYAGFDTSSLPYHPYLNAEQQSNDAVDALAAARSVLPTSDAPTVTDSGHLFVTGYSQGGYVAMATHRLLQESGAAVTASAPMSGPYAMAAFGDAAFHGQVTRTLPLFLSYTVVGYQRAYGNIYASPTEMFEPRYAPHIETLLPSGVSRSQLFAEGKLPRRQVFSSTPPDPSFTPFTPANEPHDLADVFAQGFGPENLVTNSYRAAYLLDSFANPDGGFPQVTDGLPAWNPANKLRQALKANDLRNWIPTSPVLLCAGNDDPTVLYMNTRLMYDYWRWNGVATEIRLLDLDDFDFDFDDPYLGRKFGFVVAKAAIRAAAVAGGANDGGREALTEEYHSTLVPPFCVSAAKSFFDRFF